MMQSQHNTKGPIAWMASNPVASNLLMLVLLIGGVFFMGQIKQEVFPEFDSDQVTVSVTYSGASPAEVEQGIILAIEEAVSGLDDIDEINSSANEGRATVTITLLTGGDLQKLAQDVQSEVDRISTFPDEAEEPSVEIATRKRDVISLALYGDQSEKVLHDLANDFRNTLLQNPEITQVELNGTRPLEISIEIPQEKLRAYNLTLDEVATTLSTAAIELPGGGIKTSGGEILLRMQERRDYGADFAKLPVLTDNNGTQLLLEDIATITDGFEETDRYGEYNGKRAVMIDVYRIGDQTPIEVADATKAEVALWQQQLPPGVYITAVNDRSEVFKQRLDLLLGNAYLGLSLVLILLGIFLEARLAFWVTMGIPISFLGAFIVLPALGVSINMISMFAFIVALGIVVDDAIVVGENVYKFRQQGMPPLQAAIAGAREVAMPVTFSILTNVVAFMPLYFIPGIMGKVFRVIPVVVITVFLVSLIESLFVLPAHLAHLKENRRGGLLGALHNFQQRFSQGFTRLIKHRYAPFLQLLLRFRYLTLSVSFAVLILTAALIISGRMGMTMFPRVESDFARVTVSLPYGSPVEKTEAVRDRLLASAAQVADQYGGEDLVVGTFADVGKTVNGTSGSHTLEIKVFMVDPETRAIPTAQFIQQWRKATGEISGLETIMFQSDSSGPGSGKALTVELSHTDLDILEQAGQDLAEVLSGYSIVSDIDDGFAPGKQQLDFRMRPEGLSLGLSAKEVALQVRNAYDGAEVLQQQRGRNEVTVTVRKPKNERISEFDLEEMILRSPSGIEIPLREAVDIERGRAYTSIDRRNGRRFISVTADVRPDSQSGQIKNALLADALPQLTDRYPGLAFSFEGKQADMAESMTSLVTGLGLALVMIYALLAIPFRSYMQPAIIMISIPFGIVGAVIGHLLLGYSLSVMSMFGVVALAGVVVNDSLVLIDFANRKRLTGETAHAAIVDAGILRFRPIMLTTLTTFCGLMPMIFETSRQARFMIPMAISLGFGILFATLIALLLVPCLYLIVEDIRKILKIQTPMTAATENPPVKAG
ncbi:Multidrug efflux pump subunit AcrB [Desulfuromusa kysingii]|uniref:Multidrug efflux pump subunit AcrB n=1 Tax=Desulfuromusa kysingii TaxID=37625 RepID=A0A1H4E3B6_9BACT|nr:efflux RND transporter permease subunit [Desulfuromusa kysingii]SEA79317.1 Multidrug efflux pump subunit AcrB [Desulfuromusa kysingii]